MKFHYKFWLLCPVHCKYFKIFTEIQCFMFVITVVSFIFFGMHLPDFMQKNYHQYMLNKSFQQFPKICLPLIYRHLINLHYTQFFKSFFNHHYIVFLLFLPEHFNVHDSLLSCM